MPSSNKHDCHNHCHGDDQGGGRGGGGYGGGQGGGYEGGRGGGRGRGGFQARAFFIFVDNFLRIYDDMTPWYHDGSHYHLI